MTALSAAVCWARGEQEPLPQGDQLRPLSATFMEHCCAHQDKSFKAAAAASDGSGSSP